MRLGEAVAYRLRVGNKEGRLMPLDKLGIADLNLLGIVFMSAFASFVYLEEVCGLLACQR
jgi:hypothetical protein